MAREVSLLQQVDIPSPCPVPWGKMQGGAQVRFCTRCSRHVYDLSALTEAEAERVILRSGGEFCAQVRRDRGGRIVTRPGRRAPGWLSSVLGLAASVAWALVLPGCFGGRTGGRVCLPESCRRPDPALEPAGGPGDGGDGGAALEPAP